MIKANATKTAVVNALAPGHAEALAKYFTTCTDAPRMGLERSLRYTRENKENSEQNIRDFESRIELFQADCSYSEHEEKRLLSEIAALPAVQPISVEFAEADIKNVLALPFVKEITSDDQHLIVSTREHALFTTLHRKFSRSGNWYTSKPYKIPLPAYRIRIALDAGETRANNSSLGIQLLDFDKDTGAWPGVAANRYAQEIHPHWGTTVGRKDTYKELCLGEYEGEVSSAFRKSMREGLLALAVYLQVAGTIRSYVPKRELWALWMGNPEYVKLLIPSSKDEAKELEEAKSLGSEVDDECDDCLNSDGERICDDDCGCSCHN